MKNRASGLCLTSKALLFLLLAVVLARLPLVAIELTTQAEAVHAHPGMFDLAGKKLAGGEFTEELENGRLHVKISHDFHHGHDITEEGVFRQAPELIQDEWSWREPRKEKLEREFAVHFGSRTATAKKRRNDQFEERAEPLHIQPGQT